MPTSNHQRKNTHSILSTVVSLLLVASFSTWLLQASISSYFQQTYHRPSPLSHLDSYANWRKGAENWQIANNKYNEITELLKEYSNNATKNFNEEFVLTPKYYKRLHEAEMKADFEQKKRLQDLANKKEKMDRENYLTLLGTNKVLLAGDSLMQGVAPQLQHVLKSQYQIDSLNLSKQSTGLAYPSFFDWPQTIENSVNENPEIKIVIILLGPNDPQDMPDPERRGGAFLRFGTEEWVKSYKKRIARIIHFNSQHGVSTLWVGAPGMRKENYDKKIAWLMTVIEEEVVTQGARFIDTRKPLSNKELAQDYTESLLIDGEQKRIRANDGIHCTVAGYKYISQHIIDQLRFAI